MNLLITVVYWSVLREKKLVEYAEEPEMAYHSAAAHIVPIISTLVNFLVTKIVFKYSHGLILFPIGIVYGYVNYTTTKSQGKPVYFFLTWEDESSYVTYSCLWFGTIAAYYIIAWLTRLIKKPETWSLHKTQNKLHLN